MGHFSMEIDAPTGSNLSGNQQVCSQKDSRETDCQRGETEHRSPAAATFDQKS